MKNFKTNILSFVCALCAAVSFTSCLNDSNNESSWTPPSQAEKDMACIETSGMYEGRIYFQNESTSKKDSLSINYSVTDSTVVINNFPVSFLSNYVRDINAKAIIAKAPTTSLRLKMGLNVSPTKSGTNNYYQFYFFPEYKDMKYSFRITEDTENEVKHHEAALQFQTYIYINGYPYYAAAAYLNKKMQANFCIKEIIIDGNTYAIDNVFGMAGKKGGFNEKQ